MSEIVNISIILCYFAVINLRQYLKISKFMTTNQSLDRYLTSLQGNERIAKSRDIRAILKISRAKLSNWRRGLTPLPLVYLREISEIVGVDLLVDVEI